MPCNCNRIVMTNMNGIPYFAPNNVSVTAASVNYALGFRDIPAVGYLTVASLPPVPDGTDTTLPVQFTLNNVTRSLVDYAGEAVTLADVAGGTGVILMFHNAEVGLLQLMSVLPTPAAATNSAPGASQGGN